MGKLLKKEELNRFLSNLVRKYDLIAPVKTDITRFQFIKNVDDVKDIDLEKNPTFPIKKYFFEAKHTQFEYRDSKLNVPKDNVNQIVFAARLCDLNAMLKLDRLYIDDFPDERYKNRRERTILIGFECKKPDENCFCSSMDLKQYYDLFFYENGDTYYIDVCSDKGLRLVSRLKEYHVETKPVACKLELKRKNLDRYYDSPAWQKDVDKCLSCGRCTNICPTCLCYDAYDEPDTNLQQGDHVRKWDSCQLKSFTRVAGDHVFRHDRDARFKHRIYHKLQYFRERFKEDMCVGCGRCITYCPSRINFVKTINKLR